MDLDIRRVLAAKPGPPEDVELARLYTPWGERIASDPTCLHAEYPRPRMRRDGWTCLNGLWEYAIVESSAASELWRRARPPKVFDGTILVPFSPEAPLSGVGRTLLPDQLLWYRRTLSCKAAERGMRTLLHFGAVDHACACYVNGERVCMHMGGYLPFSVDVTDVLKPGANTLELCVYDPSEQGTQLRGKQRIRRANMWYTAQSGIWQTVWMEQVPAMHVCDVRVDADADAGMATLRVCLSEPGATLSAQLVSQAGDVVAQAESIPAARETALRLTLADPHLWNPDDPYLYDLRISYGEDVVGSYCAFRTVGVEADEHGTPRFCVNHRPLFVRGLLDQGYWPDGLMTAPSDEALVADIEFARKAGFNMLRKHIKLEPERWYWHCDRLGMLVWQDMVSGGGIPGEWTSANIPTLFRSSWALLRDKGPRSWARLGAADKTYREEWAQTAREMVRRLASHPCVATWVVFNESWGQFDSAAAVESLREVDGTRPYVATSGWFDQGAGDYYAVHNYFRSMRVYPDRHHRAFLLNEFGGLTYSVDGHTSVPTIYGYDAYDDAGAWRGAFDELLAQVDALEREGLSGFVYTQLSDVEEETNGLITYDRRVNKLEL